MNLNKNFCIGINNITNLFKLFAHKCGFMIPDKCTGHGFMRGGITLLVNSAILGAEKLAALRHSTVAAQLPYQKITGRSRDSWYKEMNLMLKLDVEERDIDNDNDNLLSESESSSSPDESEVKKFKYMINCHGFPHLSFMQYSMPSFQ